MFQMTVYKYSLTQMVSIHFWEEKQKQGFDLSYRIEKQNCI